MTPEQEARILLESARSDYRNGAAAPGTTLEEFVLLRALADKRALLSERTALLEKAERAERERDNAKSTLGAWFDLATKTEEAVTPVLLDGLKGYLRTSKNGGMPTKDADTAYAVLEDFCRLYVGRELVPVVRGVAEEVAQAAESKLATLTEALEWFSGQRRLSLEWYQPVYGDDEDDADEWRVHRRRGGINDREWEMVGAGDTALKAIIDARQTIDVTLSSSGGRGNG